MASVSCRIQPFHLQLALPQAGPFDSEAKKLQGRAFRWVDKLFMAGSRQAGPRDGAAGPSGARAGPMKNGIARTALHNLLQAMPALFTTCVEQCYSFNAAIARGYFQARSVLPLAILPCIQTHCE